MVRIKKALFIVGPTATGKTDLALNTAHEMNGAVVSADSVQVYKGLDIISGKDIPPQSPFSIDHKLQKKIDPHFNMGYYQFGNVPVYLLDVIEPTSPFSVSDYVKVSSIVFEKIKEERKLPIIVGGTGFYIKALLDGIETIHIPTDKKLREELQSYTVAELQSLLMRKDLKKFESMNNSDKNNPRRLIRAIEVAGVKTPSPETEKNLIIEDPFIIGLLHPRDILAYRIHKRVEQWKKQNAVKEVAMLFKDYDRLSEQVKNSVGYKEIFEYLRGITGLEKTWKNLESAENKLAKKQMTWFKKDNRIHWFDSSQEGFQDSVLKQVKDWYNQK